MNFTKITASILSAVLCLSLCGCNGNKETNDQSGNIPQSSSDSIPKSDSSSDSLSGSSSGSASDSSPDSVPVLGNAAFLTGADGAAITSDEITSIVNSENEEIPLESLTKENFSIVTTNCAYYAKPLYPFVTDRDSEYDEAELKFKDIPQETKSDFIKVKKGDEIFGMTVTEAASQFDRNTPVIGNVVRSSLSLGGEITLSGYVRVVPGDEYGVSTGDIQFVPVGDVKLPVISYEIGFTKGVSERLTGSVMIMDGKSDRLVYSNEFNTYFSLGNISDATADISAIPTDGSIAKVNVTISDISITSTMGWFTKVNGIIVNVKAQ